MSPPILLARASPAEEVVALLLEGHGRIRAFTELAAGLAEARAPSRAEVTETATRVGRWFGEALTLHVRDEEESVLPRLAGRDRQVDAALVAMHRQHADQGTAVARVVALCAALVQAPPRHAELAPALGAAAAALRRHFERHLASEEAYVLPAIGRHLDEARCTEILREIRARRGDHSSR
ncbi:MAG TPA: hemerythrin domain-containing protein [Anaeromyxobacter sp.]|jgi:iron-sulfur cluster repair protein YtfE (RIC family)|nr:hemerythrin domain-containing protein [Anaeromyxobacter sp.]